MLIVLCILFYMFILPTLHFLWVHSMQVCVQMLLDYNNYVLYLPYKPVHVTKASMKSVLVFLTNIICLICKE